MKFLSISNCQKLFTVERNSLSSMPDLETLTINNNPSLAFIHPQVSIVLILDKLWNLEFQAISDAHNLKVLFLSNNNLTTLQNFQEHLPSLTTLYLTGNRFKVYFTVSIKFNMKFLLIKCHCSITWLQESSKLKFSAFTGKEYQS